MPRPVLLSTLALLALCAGACPDAGAIAVTVDSGPANYCRPALPAFDAQVRTRPLAIRNEGSSNVFISCAMPTESLTAGGINRTGLFAISTKHDNPTTSTGPDTIEITCTAVSGAFTAVQAVTKSLALDRGGIGNMVWTSGDFAGDVTPRAVSFSCVLPPTGAIGNILLQQDDAT